MLEIVMSLVAAVACRFMQGRHTGRYLGLKQLTILVSAKQSRTSYPLLWHACYHTSRGPLVYAFPIGLI
jgi:hypothetical protein